MMKKLMLVCAVVLFVGSAHAVISFDDLINQVCYVPDIPAITVDGDLSDWADSSALLQWGDWNLNGNAPSGDIVTIRYAFNDAANMMYMGVESTKPGLALEIGTPTFVGDSHGDESYGGDGTTVQTALYSWLNGGPDPAVIGAYPGIDAVASASIEVVYTVDGTTGDWTYEIAMPIWSKFYSGDSGTTTILDLAPGDVLWTYAASPGDDLSSVMSNDGTLYHYGEQRDLFATKMFLGGYDLRAFASFASAWLSDDGDASFEPGWDIAEPADQTIDILDLQAFCERWVVGS